MTTNDEEVITQENDTETTENTEETEQGDDVEELKKQIVTLQAQKEHWRTKASEKKEEVKEEVKADLGVTDIMYLAKADIHDEDVTDVLNYSKKMGVSVKEAHTFMKPILKERAEERKTVEATETKSARKANHKDPGSLLDRAQSTGELPESDADLKALIRARLERKRK